MPTTSPHPEDYYRTSDKTERRRIQLVIVTEHRDRVAALVRRGVPKRLRAEACQVGALGLLVALEKYDPERSGPDRGKKSFWGFAFPYVREEIRVWLDHAAGWQNTKMSKAKRAEMEARGTAPKPVASMDADNSLGLTLHDFVKADVSVEGDVVDVEVARRLKLFAETLNAGEREVLFSDNEKTRSSRLHLILTERAAAFVKDGERWRSKTLTSFTASSSRRAG